MKKMIVVIICMLLVGCTTSEINNTNDNLYKQYVNYKKILFEQQSFQNGSEEFTIKLIINKIDDNKNRYDIIIDSPKINMYHLQAIAKVEQDDGDTLPSLGILEEETFSLIPNKVDKSKGIYKGINLSGITKQDKFDVLVYLTFYNDESTKNKEERFIRVYDDKTR